jgi:hypothetical protein
MSNLLQSCWAAHGQLLSAEGLSEHHLQQTWQVVCSGISSSVQQGRGHKVPGICTVLAHAAGQQGIKVLLSDTLLKTAPGMQLGKGCVHHASVRQQVQGVETLNTAKLAHRQVQSRHHKQYLQTSYSCADITWMCCCNGQVQSRPKSRCHQARSATADRHSGQAADSTTGV